MKKKCIPFLLIILVLLAACHTPRYMYSPAAQNVPVLVKKGDSKLSANYSSDLSGSLFTNTSVTGKTKKSNGFDLQGAVAITNGLAVQANYFNRTERNGATENNFDSTGINYKRNLAEFGIGYFTSMHRHNKVMFEVFGGAGKGKFSFTEKGKDYNNIYYARSHRVDVLKLYVQPAFVFRIRDNFSMSVSTRFSFINYSNIKTDYTQTELENNRLNDLPGGYRSFFEPAFTNTFGFNKLPGLKFEYQFSFALQDGERTIDYRSFNFSIGILADLLKLFKWAPNKGSE